MLRRLFSHTFIYGAAPHVPKIAGFFVLPIITSYLTPTDFGIYGIVNSTTGSIAVLASLGLRVVLVNSFYKSPTRYKFLWRQIYGFLHLWSILYAFLTFLVCYFVFSDQLFNNLLLIIFLNVIPALFLGQAATFASTYYQISKKPFPIVIRTIVFGFMTVFLNWFFIAELRMGYMGWFWTNFIVSILNSVSYWIPLNFKMKIKPIFNFKWKTIKKSLKVSLPTIPHFYSSYLLNSSDRMVMQLTQVSVTDIGKYNAAYMFGNYFSNLGSASGTAIGPLLNECYAKKEDLKARNLIFVQQAFFITITFVVSIWLKELFEIFIKNDVLNKMYGLGVIIVMAYTYRPMYFGSNSKLMFTENTSYLWRISFTAGAINFVLNFIFIPLYGFEVAAYTTFISLMFLGYAGFFLGKFKEINTVNYYPLFWLTLTILATVLAFYATELGLFFKVCLTLLTLVAALLLFLKLRRLSHGYK